MAVEIEFVRGTIAACAITTVCAVLAVLLFVGNVCVTMLVLVVVVEMLGLVLGTIVLRGQGLGVVEVNTHKCCCGTLLRK
jgi:hypothetical protein